LGENLPNLVTLLAKLRQQQRRPKFDKSFEKKSRFHSDTGGQQKGIRWSVPDRLLKQGCQIFLGTMYQNGKNAPNYHRIYQMILK
jgi:hypothetical protein